MNSQESSRIQKIGLSTEEILENITDAFYAVDTDWRLTYINHRAEELWHRSRSELLGTVLWDMFPEARHTVDWEMHHKAARERIPVHWETYNPNLNAWVNTHAYPSSDGGTAVYFCDITERKAAEEALRHEKKRAEEERDQLLSLIAEEKDRLRATLASIDDEVWFCDLEGNISLQNQAAKKGLGQLGLDIGDGTPLDAIADALEILKPDGTPRSRENAPLFRSLKGETLQEDEIIRHVNTGELRYRTYRSSPFRDSTGHIIGAIAIARDITDLKRLEQHQILLSEISQELIGLNRIAETMNRLSEKIGRYFGVVWAMYSELVEDNEVSIASHGWNADGAISLRGTYRMQDFLSDEQLARNNAGELTIVSDTQADPRVSAESYGALGIRSFIIVPISRDGQWCFMLSIIDNKPRQWRDDEVTLMREITARIWARLERARAEEALRKSERVHAFQSAILESVRDPLWATDSGLRIVYWNDAATATFDWTADEVLGRHTGELFRTLVPGSTRDDAVAQLLQTGDYRGEIVCHCKDGRPIIAEASSRVVRGPDGEVVRIVSTARDITERKRLEEELRQHRENLERLIEERTEQLLRSERHYRTLVENLPLFIAQLDTDFRYRYSSPQSLDKFGYDSSIIGKTWEEIGIPQEYCQLYGWRFTEVMRTGKPVAHEHRLADRHGNTLDLEVIIAPVFDEYGQVESLLSISQDVTERKKTEAELQRLDRLNTVGEMAAAIGHEVRNPMTTVRGYLQMMQRKKEYAEHHEQFKTMIEEIDRANLIISDFLSLAKNKAVEMQSHNLNDVITTLLPLLQAEALRTNHELKIDTTEIPDFIMDEKEIRQMLLNLTNNAFQAMEFCGKLTISTRASDGEVILIVHDTGKGIPKEVLDRLGTPFMTTKENGTGLGLAVCYRIADRHSAKIDVQTSPVGTAFVISFPIEDAQ